MELELKKKAFIESEEYDKGTALLVGEIKTDQEGELVKIKVTLTGPNGHVSLLLEKFGMVNIGSKGVFQLKERRSTLKEEENESVQVQES